MNGRGGLPAQPLTCPALPPLPSQSTYLISRPVCQVNYFYFTRRRPLATPNLFHQKLNDINSFRSDFEIDPSALSQIDANALSLPVSHQQLSNPI